MSARVGDRAVAIAAFLAILATGFFGDEPKPPPTATTHATPRTASP
jgi:hypothetical protein